MVDFTGGTWRSLIDGSEVRAIPDTSMLQSPIYQFWAGGLDVADGTTGVTIPEQIAGLSDPTPQNSPTFRADQSGFAAVDYHAQDNDYHTWEPDANLPTGDSPYTVLCTVYFKDNDSTDNLGGWGNDGSTDQSTRFRNSNGTPEAFIWGSVAEGSSTVPTGQWTTLGMRYDQSNLDVIFAGAQDGSTSVTGANIQDQDHTIAANHGGGNAANVFLYEWIVSDTAESDTEISEYHNDRIA